MKTFTKLMAATAVALSMAAASAPANAATIFNLIDQTVLDLTGTENFGATIDSIGLFNHSFFFNVTGPSDASGSVVTVRTAGALRDLDFTSIDLDGLFAFTPLGGLPGAEPGETWNLFTATLSGGLHSINVKGSVVSAAAGRSAASYGGTLNVTSLAVPEPGTWALMILGFGGAGAMLRSRRRSNAVTA